jgi:hypothetical protein
VDVDVDEALEAEKMIVRRQNWSRSVAPIFTQVLNTFAQQGAAGKILALVDF